MSFLDIVSKFNQQADGHSKSQSLNPFSERFEQSRSPSPRFSREDYGKPVAGSKTDLRGRKAKTHICREILELCTVIHDVGTYNAKKRTPEDDDDDNEDDGTIIVSFGELFQIYTKISDKVVGLLIAAKRRGFVYFDREILFQRRDDDVLIALLKPISEISKILKDDISQTNAPAPAVESKPAEKKKSTSSSKTKRVQPPVECNNEQTQKIDNSTTTVDQTKNVILEVNGDVVVQPVENNGGNDGDGETIKRDENVNGDGGVAAEGTAVENGINNDEDKTNHVEDVVVDGGEAVVEIETHDGTNGGDDEILNGEQVVEIQINGEVTVAEDEIKRDDEVPETVVVEGEVVHNVGEVSESIEVESNIRDPCEDDVIEETTKSIDLNESSAEVIEGKNENVDSSDGKDEEEKIEDVQDDKSVNGDKVDVTYESIEGVSSCNGVESINGQIEHIIPITMEN